MKVSRILKTALLVGVLAATALPATATAATQVHFFNGYLCSGCRDTDGSQYVEHLYSRIYGPYYSGRYYTAGYLSFPAGNYYEAAGYYLPVQQNHTTSYYGISAKYTCSRQDSVGGTTGNDCYSTNP